MNDQTTNNSSPSMNEPLHTHNLVQVRYVGTTPANSYVYINPANIDSIEITTSRDSHNCVAYIKTVSGDSYKVESVEQDTSRFAKSLSTKFGFDGVDVSLSC